MLSPDNEDGSSFPGETHPAMVALRAGREASAAMGVFNPRHDEYRWIDVHATPQFRPGEDKPFQVYATFDDITGRKRATEALRQARERLELVIEGADVGVYDANLRTGDVAVNPLSPELETAVFRIAQEAVHNALRYGQARHITMTVVADHEELSLAIQDDGGGFDPNPSGTGREAGLGLIGMRERAELLGGRFALASRPGAGTRVEVTIPLPEAAS